MTPQEKIEFDTIKRKIEQMENLLNMGNLPDKKIFDKTVLFNKGIKLHNNAFIYGGSATGDANIKLDIGTPSGGSLYISTANNGELWVMQTSTWTEVTIP